MKSSEIFSELSQVALTYIQNGAHYPSSKDGKKQRAVYFVRLVYNQDTKDIYSEVSKSYIFF